MFFSQKSLHKTIKMSDLNNVEVINLGDVTKICRLCLEKNIMLQPLQESPHLEHLRKITILPLKLDSKLPKSVCDQCLEHLSLLEQMTRFLAHCKRSQQILKEFYKHAVVGECIVKRQVQVKGQIVLEVIRGVLPENEQDTFENVRNDSENAVKNSTEVSEHIQPPEDIEIKLELDVEYEEFPNDLVEQVQTTFTNETLNNPTDIGIPSVKNNSEELKNEQILVEDTGLESVQVTFTKEDNTNEPKLLPLNAVFLEVPSFPEEEDISDQTSVHSEDDFIFQCDQCKFGTDSAEVIVNHTIIVHGGTRKVGCPECKQFVNNLEKHKLEFDGKCALKQRRESQQQMCDHCGILVNVNDFSNHLSQCIDLKCIRCDFIAANLVKLTRHIALKHRNKALKQRTSSCRVCLKHDIKDLMAHRRGNRECQFKCTMCDFRTIHKSSVNSHRHNIHSDVRRLFPCDKCGVRLKSAASLRSHKEVHDLPPKFQCSYCLRKFSTEPHMQGHIDLVHLGLKPYKCDHCDESFAFYMTRLRHSLKQHPHKYESQTADEIRLLNYKTRDLTVPSANDQFECEQCYKTFKTEVGCKAHQLEHVQPKIEIVVHPSKCPQCDYQNMNRRDMRAHMREHHNTSHK